MWIYLRIFELLRSYGNGILKQRFVSLIKYYDEYRTLDILHLYIFVYYVQSVHN